MFRFKGSIEYADGLVVEFEAGNVGLAKWERYAMRNKLPIGKDSPATISSLVIAHHALGIEQGFDAWVETVEGIELNKKDEVVERKQLLAFFGLDADATDADVKEAVAVALATTEDVEVEVPPTLREASTV